MIYLTDDSISLLFADSNVTTVKDLRDAKDYILYVTPAGRESLIEGVVNCNSSKVHFYKSGISDYRGYVNANDKILYNSADVISIPVWNHLGDDFLELQWMLGFEVYYTTVLLPGGVDGYGVYLFFHKQANKRLGVL